MIFVGIDVASQKHDIAITTLYGEILNEGFTIDNSSDGFKKLHQEILSHTESIDIVRIGIEETGIYSKNISEFLALHGFTVHLINPILTSNSRKAQSVRLTKTDKIDALAICRYVEFNFKRLNSYTPSLYTVDSLKSLSRTRIDKLKKLSRAKGEWTRLLDIYFPEFRKHYNQHSKWVYELFSKYNSVDKITRIHDSTLLSIIKVHSNRNEDVNFIKSLAKNTIGSSDSNSSLLIQYALEDIAHYNKQVRHLEKEIERIVNEEYSYLLSVPGIGSNLAGLIIGEIGDISRFDSPSALVAYAGLDPIVFESGTFKANRVSISKRGSKYLRTAVFTATRIACVNPIVKDNKFRHKYLKKRSEGKHHNSAVCNVSKNMINVIFKLMKDKSNFDFNI